MTGVHTPGLPPKVQIREIIKTRIQSGWNTISKPGLFSQLLPLSQVQREARQTSKPEVIRPRDAARVPRANLRTSSKPALPILIFCGVGGWGVGSASHHLPSLLNLRLSPSSMGRGCRDLLFLLDRAAATTFRGQLSTQGERVSTSLQQASPGSPPGLHPSACSVNHFYLLPEVGTSKPRCLISFLHLFCISAMPHSYSPVRDDCDGERRRAAQRGGVV